MPIQSIFHGFVFLAAITICVGVAPLMADQPGSDSVYIERPAARNTDSAGQMDNIKFRDEPLSLVQTEDASGEDSEVISERTTIETRETTEPGGYRGASEFFNIREANPNVGKGQFEFLVRSAWTTRSDGRDDDVNIGSELKYGITNDLFVGVELLPLNLGDGDNVGNGDLGLTVFNRFVRETDTLPAIAAWARMRIPTGDGSAGVDAEFHGTFTKQVATNCRLHLDGFVMTANGGRDERDDNRRHFQWGIGAGTDYQLDDDTLLLANYLHRSSDQYGHHNQNILELGVDRRITEGQNLKIAADIGLDGAEETPNFALRLQYGFVW